MRIELFGDFRFIAGARPTSTPPRKTVSLLAFLIVHRDAPVPRSRIAAALWPDVPDEDALTNVRRHLLLLQRLFTEFDVAPLESERRALRWAGSPAITVDVERFEDLAASPATEDAALELYRGDLLEEFDDEWLRPIRERYRTQCLQLLDGAFQRNVRDNELAEALTRGKRLLTLDPMREDVARALMELRLANGDRAGSLETYRELARRVADEFGAQPMAETTALYEEIRSGNRQPPQRVGVAPRASATSFVGRSKELAELRATLKETRLLSLVGVGGIGKSRLAKALAEDAAYGFADGTRFVELAGLAEDETPLQALVRALGLAQMSAEAMQRVVIEHLRQQRMLVVLDNCERHLEGCRELIESVLAACRHVAFVITSRLPLGLGRELVFRVGPLAIPMKFDAAASRSSLDADAVQLFIERARAAGAPDTLDPAEEAAVVAICRHFDGVPLAIELAAARRGLLSARQILERLDDSALVVDYAHERLPAHQRTVRSAIAWTFDSLSAEQRRSLCVLAIFRGPFAIGAVEAVTGTTGAAALDLLGSLVDSSLLAVAHTGKDVRYAMLEPVREFAAAELESSAQAPTAYARAVDYYATVPTAVGLSDESLDVRGAFEALEWERSNIRAVLEGCARHRVAKQPAQDLAASLVSFWQEHGHVADGVAVHDLLLGAFAEEQPPMTLFLGASRFARLSADYERARSYAQRALTGARARGEHAAEVDALHAEALVDYTAGDLEAAEQRHRNAREIAAALGDRVREGRALANLGLIAIQRDAHDAAAQFLGEAVRLLDSSGNARLLAEATSALSYCERFRGNLGESRAFSKRAVAAAYESGNTSLLSTGLSNLAHLAVLEGDYAGSLVYLRESLELARTGAFLFTLAHDLEVTARLFYGLRRFRDAAIFLYAARNLSKRFRLLRTRQEEDALGELERVLAGDLSALEIAEASILLRDAAPSRCVDEALSRLATLDEARRGPAQATYGSTSVQP